MRKKVAVGLATVAAVFCMAFIGAYMAYQKYASSSVFFPNTQVNDVDVSGMTVDEAVTAVNERYQLQDMESTPVLIMDGSDAIITGTLGQMGYAYGVDDLENTLRQEFVLQHSNIVQLVKAMRNGTTIAIDANFTGNPLAIEEAVQEKNFSIPRTQTVDPYVDMDEKTGRYTVIPGVRGDEIDVEALQAAVTNLLDELVQPGNIPEYITISVPDDCYCSPMPEDDMDALQAECDEKNRELALEPYKDLVITYTYGEESDVLDFDAIEDWLSVNDKGKVVVDENSVREYVRNMGQTYDTRYHDRNFTTTYGQQVTIPGEMNEYGYTVLEDEEYKRLLGQIKNCESATQEPIYEETNVFGNPYYYKRNGTDDLAGCYVEANLTAQHLWFYMDGDLIVESDFVSGDVSRNRETAVGTFPLAYKESPSILRGNDAFGGYATQVGWWMPFYEGQGLHDASWRSAFGGDIYQYDGSHGCINLPPDVAETIYNNIQAGVAIVIYK